MSGVGRKLAVGSSHFTSSTKGEKRRVAVVSMQIQTFQAGHVPHLLAIRFLPISPTLSLQSLLIEFSWLCNVIFMRMISLSVKNTPMRFLLVKETLLRSKLGRLLPPTLERPVICLFPRTNAPCSGCSYRSVR